MPLNGSGPISIGGSTAGQSINLEFGRTATQQTSMSQLYRGGGIVPDASVNNNIPTSGTISLSQFYNAANRISQTITISSNQTNYVANTAKVSGYTAGIMDVTFVINSGIYCSSNATGTPGLDVDTSWDAGDTVTIVNNGFIVGRGGNGGAGAGTNASGFLVAGAAGSAGGLAFRTQRAISVNNAGTIAGGGGGGGGGRNGNWPVGSFNVTAGAGGGGGGRSSNTNSTGGAGGLNAGAGGAAAGTTGGSGTVSANGGGGAGGTTSGNTAGAGGAGGAWGAAGNTGGNPTAGTTGIQMGGPYSGGSAGAAVSGNSNVTWVATGTRLGAIT